MEDRTLLAASVLPPHVSAITADNRGQVRIILDAPLNSATVSKLSAAILVNGKKMATGVYYGSNQILLVAALKANTTYTFWLNSKIIKGTNGKFLDGEFNGIGKKSGNGIAGGDFVAVAKPAVGTKYVRFDTNVGNIDFKLVASTTITDNNFMSYANAASWDNGIFHRGTKQIVNADNSVSGIAVIQGGGFKLNNTSIDPVTARAAITNEAVAAYNIAHVVANPNLFGTLSTALSSDANTHLTLLDSATNQWFVNLADNSQNFSSTGLDAVGNMYTVFAKVANTASINVLKLLKQIVDQGPYKTLSGLPELPVIDLNALKTRDLQINDLIMTYRIAVLSDVVKPTAPASSVAVPRPAAAVAMPLVAARPAPAAQSTVQNVLSAILNPTTRFSTTTI